MDKQKYVNSIIPYLAHGLEVNIKNAKCDYVGIEKAKVNGFYYLADVLHLTYEGGSTGKSNSEAKPLLIPLTKLTEHAANVMTGRSLKYLLRDIKSQSLPAITWSELLSEHFDVLDLIGEGYAEEKETRQWEESQK